MKISRHQGTGNRRARYALGGAALFAFALLACSGSGGPTAIEIPIARIQIVSACTVIVEGNTCTIGVRAFAEDGRQVGNPVLRFLSTNENAASVSTRGVVSGRAPGTSTILVSNSTSTVNQQFRVDVLPRGAPK
jgi:hypothetical protein